MTFDVNRLVRESFVARVEHHAELGSTNDRAKQCAAGGVGALPLLILADRQTAGRGRGSNRWWSGCGGLALSLLLDGGAWPRDPAPGPLVSLAAAVAVVRVAAHLLPGHAVGIRWPNDVFAAGRKLAGILVEVLPGGLCVVGVGLNLNNTIREGPAELQSTASSLLDLTGRRHDPTKTVLALLEQFALLVRHLPVAPGEISRLADELCLQKGETLSVQSGGKTIRGRCRQIASDGTLLLETSHGPARIASGVVTPG